MLKPKGSKRNPWYDKVGTLQTAAGSVQVDVYHTHLHSVDDIQLTICNKFGAVLSSDEAQRLVALLQTAIGACNVKNTSHKNVS